MKTVNCLLCGVGGQGTVLLSRLIGAAAMARGFSVRGTETIGMAQRGGSVVSHVRMGDDIASPLIGKGAADVLISFEPGEGVRALPWLAPGGMVIVCDRPVPPVTGLLGGAAYSGADMVDFLRQNAPNLVVINGDAMMGRLGSPRALNVALLGAAVAAGALPFGLADARAALTARLAERFHTVNLAALQAGAEAVTRGC